MGAENFVEQGHNANTLESGIFELYKEYTGNQNEAQRRLIDDKNTANQKVNATIFCKQDSGREMLLALTFYLRF